MYKRQVRDSVLEYIENKLAAGSVIGVDLQFIDLAQGDHGYYRHCPNCMKVMKEENGAASGPVVGFANRIDEEVSEQYEGLAYLIFAYIGTQPACVTPASSGVRVTFAPNGCCSAHKLRGGECNEQFSLYAVTASDIINNDDFGEWLETWCKLCDNVYVWYYLWLLYTSANRAESHTFRARAVGIVEREHTPVSYTHLNVERLSRCVMPE